MLDEFVSLPRVAYFSMEIALRNEIPTYAGGLGVLAGDTLRSAADLQLPLVGVTLVSRAGYFRQEIDPGGRQLEQPATWEPARWAQPLDAKVAVRIEDRPVWVSVWLYVIESHLGGRTPVLLLDTNLPENRVDDREITHYLYGGDDAYRLKQEMVLGFGGVRILRALAFEISAYHMNEGHSALLGVELMRRFAYLAEDLRPGDPPYDLPRVRDLCRFTTHTPVEAGHDRFSYDLVKQLLASSVYGYDDRKAPKPGALGTEHGPIDFSVLTALAGPDALNMTQLALACSDFVNGVAKRHAEVSAKMYPGHQVRAITNGVHPYAWSVASFRAVYDRHVPGWHHEPELLARVHGVADQEILAAHAQAKQALITRVKALTDVTLDPAVATLGFARRMTAYKRPEMFFTDIGRLRRIARRYPLQIVLGGKAHPHDQEGKQLITRLHEHARELAGAITVVYLPDYDLDLALLMVSGTDVWINTPLPPLEASGTSGMKAAFNGVPSLSVCDGWWVEGCIEGVTGWAVEDAASLYEKLESVVLPQFYATGDGRHAWVRIMKAVIAINAAYFNSHRMMRRYATEAYLR
jgi:starch phosphorylase